MALPKSVRIGYETYRIEEMPLDVKNEGDFGCGDQLIRVKTKDRSARFVANTLLHEIMHGVFYHAGLHNMLSRSKEEMIVNSFANGIIQVFRDNPSFVRLLVKAK